MKRYSVTVEGDKLDAQLNEVVTFMFEPEYKDGTLTFREVGQRWLIEEFAVREPMGDEIIQWHTIEEAPTPQAAFELAHQRSLKTRKLMGEPMGLYFVASELTIIDEDYRWAASDGSSVCYEVRKLDG